MTVSTNIILTSVLQFIVNAETGQVTLGPLAEGYDEGPTPEPEPETP